MNMKNTVEGQIITTGKGIGFVKVPDLEEDILIETPNLNTALPGDTVRVKILPEGVEDRRTKEKRTAGEVIAIISRAREQFVGTVVEEGGKIEVQPDNQKVYVNFEISDGELEPRINQKVLVQMTGWEKEKEKPTGRIIKIFGMKGEHEVEIQSIIYEKGFVADFSEEIEAEAENIKKKWTPFPEEEIAKRRDLRDEVIMTIDPADAKDFDDALSIKTLDNGNYEVGIHIADVSHYVTPGSKLDKEAFKRQFSVYLVDRTIPMLPEILSNDLCSLNPSEEKFAFSAIFELNSNAEVLSRWFGKTIISSKKRFTYEEAQAILDAESGPFVEELMTLNGFAKKMQKRNKDAGAIEFEGEEIKFELDKEGRPIRIIKKERLDTHKLVEEMMLLANREVAKYIHDTGNKMGGNSKELMYRIHDEPNSEKVEKLSVLLKALGYHLPITEDGSVTAKDLNSLFSDIDGKPEENLIKTASVRTMSKAIYSTINSGHFGLAFQYYTHFTSPIRRYPDLLVHRILQSFLIGKEISQTEKIHFEQSATTASERELSATEAERESIKYKQAEYMMDHVGETFEGVISGVSPYGIYVQLTETLTEGMVHISKLGNDFFSLDEKNYSVVGEKTNKKFSLGDTVKVKIEKIDLDLKRIDMTMA
jgi:ribonuclease R